MSDPIQNSKSFKLPLYEKIGYALGDTASNLAWRSLTTFLLVFYTDVFGIPAAAAGVLLLITRLTDGVTDIIMGTIADRTQTSKGKFRPWILWTAVPFGILMALTFTTPNLGLTGKLIWAYTTYILLTLIYTASNVPYSALMGVMTSNQEERTALSSFRFAGAYLGGIIVQGGLIYLVTFLGNGDENNGYRYAMYVMAILASVLLLTTYATTKERVAAPVEKSNVKDDLKDLLSNKPWLILLFIGFFFVIFNSIKQGITVIYFKRFIQNEVLSASYMIVLLVASVVAAFATMPLAKRIGKKSLFIAAMVLSGVFTSAMYIADSSQIGLIFVLGSIAEFGAGILPVLFFSMLGDSADYSEYKTGRRATGLFYSAGTFAMKFGGGVAGAIIGFVLARFGYDGMDESTVLGAIPGIKMLMSWIPSVFLIFAIALMYAYPLTRKKMEHIGKELDIRREGSASKSVSEEGELETV